MHLARIRCELGDRQLFYKDLLRSQGVIGFGEVADAVRLLPQMFKLTRGGFCSNHAVNEMASVRAKEKKFDWPQPKGPSEVGKMTTAIAMVQGPYKEVYSWQYIFRPSYAKGIDTASDGWRKHVNGYMKLPHSEQIMRDTSEPAVLHKCMKRHA